MPRKTGPCFWIFAVTLENYRLLVEKYPGDVRGTPTPRPKPGHAVGVSPEPAKSVLVAIGANKPDLKAKCDVIFLASPMFSTPDRAREYVASGAGRAFRSKSLNGVLYQLNDG